MDVNLLCFLYFCIYSIILIYTCTQERGFIMRRMTKDGYWLNRHSCFLLQYHLVLVTKYRNPVLTGRIKDHVYHTIRSTMEEKNIHIIEMNGEADHIHILFECGPEIAPLALATVLKTRSARFVRRDLMEEVKKYYWSDEPLFWSKSYFVCTIGENNKEAVEKYIQNQGNK